MPLESWDQIVGMVGAAAREAKPGDWIIGRGWHQEKWDTKPTPNVHGFPVHNSLSRVSPNNPVLLTHASGHASFANAAAMARAGITRNTADPPGGEIMKDAEGNPIGLMNERAQGLVRDAMNRDLAKRTARKGQPAQDSDAYETWLDHRLKSLYQPMLDAPLPDDMKKLLRTRKPS